MAEDRNTFLNADSIYEEVEGESGVQLTLEEDQQRNLIGIIKGRYAQAEEARQTDESRWLKAYETTEVFMLRVLSLENLKSLESL